MALKVSRPKRQELSAERQAEIRIQLQNAKVFPKTPKVWEGFENHVEIFSMVNYVGEDLLMYVPKAVLKVTRLDEEGNTYIEELEQDYLPIIQFDLRDYEGNFLGRVRSTNFDNPIPEMGISGQSPINDYRELSNRLYRAMLGTDLIRTYGTDNVSELDEETVKNARSRVNKKSPIAIPKTVHFVPIAVFVKNENGKGLLTDENGKLVYRLAWYRASENQIKKWSKAFLDNTSSLDDSYDKDYVALNYGGSVAKVSFPDNDIKDASLRMMRSAQDMTVSFLDFDSRQLSALRPKLEEVMPEIEELASKYYTQDVLGESVIEATLFSDEDLTATLEDKYSDLQSRVEFAERTYEELRASVTNGVPTEVKSESKGIEDALAVPKTVGQLEHTSEDDLDIDFEAE